MQRWNLIAVATLGLMLAATPLTAQLAEQPAPAGEEHDGDPLGRDTPRGTVVGFLDAARRGEYVVARQFLDPRLSVDEADARARELFVVLDARLPARVAQISDRPAGSRADLLYPDRELVGAIPARRGAVDIYVQRSSRGRTAGLWLFPESTLAAIPTLFHEVTTDERRASLPAFLTRPGPAGLRLLDWIVLVAGIPLFLIGAALINRVMRLLLRPAWRRLGREDSAPRDTLPMPARLLLLALAGRWVVSSLPLALVARQFWSGAAGIIAIVSVVWLFILLNGEIEDVLRRRLPRAESGAGSALLRVLRRVVDVAFVLAGFFVVLWRFGIDLTPAMAGLGVGGIAVALAAQKTLENVIAGASLIFDQAVRVGDYLRVGTIEGTVDHIGLRSTRIRTPERTIVTVPNGQIATLSLETVSTRDKYWFHPDVRLRYDTTPQQLHAVLQGIRALLASQPSVDQPSIRVRFVRLAAFSFDVEVFAYVFADDLGGFLEIQERLLFGVTEAVERAGARLALPSQTMYVAGGDRAHAVLPPAAEVGQA